ncbi:hypothetical protein ZIOFF_042531 [Zingiber officinale]|uniref:Uncharacterized protein n=1 Tax=Zingiber officinale TaxID=94328 RepID=A0A8J5KY00_ZINOF|nr:hypothetical protein ZIOFF_042531 [Zingiber officinale]
MASKIWHDRGRIPDEITPDSRHDRAGIRLRSRPVGSVQSHDRVHSAASDCLESGRRSRRRVSTGCMDFDMTLVMEQRLIAITETSTKAIKTLYEAWVRSNGLSLNLMKMIENVKPSMPKIDNAREFIKLIKEYSQLEITDKSIMGTFDKVEVDGNGCE